VKPEKGPAFVDKNLKVVSMWKSVDNTFSVAQRLGCTLVEPALINFICGSRPNHLYE